jgi:hypothetical protein
VDRPRRYLGERLEHESSAVHPRVRHDQAALKNLPLPIEHHVDIDAPGAVAERGALPHSLLNPLEAFEQFPRAQARPQLQNPIYKFSLRSIAHRRCAVKERDPNDPDPRFAADQIERHSKVFGAPADIRPDRKKNPFSAGSYTAPVILEILLETIACSFSAHGNILTYCFKILIILFQLSSTSDKSATVPRLMLGLLINM